MDRIDACFPKDIASLDSLSQIGLTRLIRPFTDCESKDHCLGFVLPLKPKTVCLRFHRKNNSGCRNTHLCDIRQSIPDSSLLTAQENQDQSQLTKHTPTVES
jgi:hypothetical protein